MYEDIEIMRRILETGLSRARSAAVGHGQRLAPVVGQGAAFLDYDSDGYLDLFVAQEGTHKLFRNDGKGHFTDVTAQAGNGIVVADVNSDGRPDVYITHLGLGAGGGKLFVAGGHGGLPAAEAFEGTYLKGQGVVFTATLPVLWEQVAKTVAAPVRKPLSEWEQVRRELRGEKIEAEEKAPPRHDDTLADVLVKMLAENGHNFSQLPENEQVTVALTLRRGQACEQCHSTPWSNVSPKPATEGAGGKGNTGGKTGAADTSTREAAVKGLQALGQNVSARDQVMAAKLKRVGVIEGTIEEETAALQSEAQDQALLGDLHMKQGRPKDAVAAYQKAVESYQKALNQRPNALAGSSSPSKRDTQEYLTALELYTKLARSALAANDADRTGTAYQMLAKYYRSLEAVAQRDQNAKQAAANGHRPATAGIELPSKFILSASKKLLDQVAAGKISLEDFKKGVAVQYLTFPGGKGSPAPKDKPTGY
jgi:tetratricopeptide (TPR) repeat protein